MALGIILVLKDNFPPKRENYESPTAIRTRVKDLMSFLMREPGRYYNYSKEKHKFIWNSEMSDEYTSGPEAGLF